MSVIPALAKLRQEDCCEFQASLACTVGAIQGHLIGCYVKKTNTFINATHMRVIVYILLPAFPHSPGSAFATTLPSLLPNLSLSL